MKLYVTARRRRDRAQVYTLLIKATSWVDLGISSFILVKQVQLESVFIYYYRYLSINGI